MQTHVTCLRRRGRTGAGQSLRFIFSGCAASCKMSLNMTCNCCKDTSLCRVRWHRSLRALYLLCSWPTMQTFCNLGIVRGMKADLQEVFWSR